MRRRNNDGDAPGDTAKGTWLDEPTRNGGGKPVRMRRRDFLAAVGGAVTSPRLAWVQQRGLPTVGFLYAGSLAQGQTTVDAFRGGLAETGYVEGRNVAIEFREAGGDVARLPELARDLVSRRVDVIVAPGNRPAVLAAMAATATIPIVFGNASDPIEAGFVTSLSHPGGNVTGVSDFGIELSAKRLELIKLLVPAASSIALLVRASNPLAERELANASEGARALGIEVLVFWAGTDEEIDAAFARLAEKRADGVSLVPNILFSLRRKRIIALASRYRVPAVYPFIEFAQAGGLMSYGSSLTERNRLTGVYAGLILNGTRPADLPVRRIERFELAINMTTAKALGLTVPARFLTLADRIIE